jgi:2-succinyl-5-enolpyruvyl-6-hydroxy-3-cyclohexene-1-carboxylate synthase
MNPATAFATVLADELIRCGLREAVLAPGSRSTPLALALHDRAAAGELRLHVRIDERSAAFTALGLAKASRRPVALACTSGTAAAHFHPAVIEADEACVPLIVITADRPPELRGTGANQTIDQLKLYGGAVRWFCETGVPEARAGMAGYWRSVACRAWAHAGGQAAGLPGPVHLNVAFREPLVPDAGGPWAAGSADGPESSGPGLAEPGLAGPGLAGPGLAGPGLAGPGWSGPGWSGAGSGDWPEPLDGRPGGRPWTRFPGAGQRSRTEPGWTEPDRTEPDRTEPGWTELDWAERGVLVCGDGDYDPAPLAGLAETAGWPVLAEPSSNARRGPNALSAYGYLLAAPAFTAAHRPDLIVSAGRPGLSRPQLAFLKGAPGPVPARHVVLAQGPGRWADPARSATEVTAAVRLASEAGWHARAAPGEPRRSSWLDSWRAADAAARAAADAILDSGPLLSEPRLARDLAAALPAGGLLWAASSLPVRDLDLHMRPRADLRVLASRGASGIDGLISSAIGAALAHQAAGGGPAAALLGDLAFLHDAPGLMLGPDEPRPDLCLVVVNNNGGGIFSDLEQAAVAGPFERVFGTPHDADLGSLARAARMPYTRLERPADLPGALAGDGVRVVEVRTDRAAGAQLRAALRAACSAAAGSPRLAR